MKGPIACGGTHSIVRQRFGGRILKSGFTLRWANIRESFQRGRSAVLSGFLPICSTRRRTFPLNKIGDLACIGTPRQSLWIACANDPTAPALPGHHLSSTEPGSSPANRPMQWVNRVFSAALTWSQTAILSFPADGVATTIGGRGTGPVESGTTTTVRRARFKASAVRITLGRVLRISLPRMGVKIDPPDLASLHRSRWREPLSHGPAVFAASNPSPIVTSQSDISAATCSSRSTSHAARYSGSSSSAPGGNASPISLCTNALRTGGTRRF